MSDGPISFATLNAYVDGELDATAAAEVARAVAEDAALARQVAALSRLRSAVAEGIEAPPLAVPARPASGGRRIAYAAGIGIALFVAGSVLVSRLDRDPGSEWLQRAWQMHRSWSIEEPAAQPAGRIAAGFAQAVTGVHVPDLSAARLSIVHATVVPLPENQRALLVGYRGTRG